MTECVFLMQAEQFIRCSFREFDADSFSTTEGPGRWVTKYFAANGSFCVVGGETYSGHESIIAAVTPPSPRKTDHHIEDTVSGCPDSGLKIQSWMSYADATPLLVAKGFVIEGDADGNVTMHR